MTRHLKFSTSSSAGPRPEPPSSGQTPAQPPQEDQRRTLAFSTRITRTPAWDPALFPGAAFYVDTSRSAITLANVVSGTGANLTKSGSTITVSGASGLVASHSGGSITLTGYAAGNNGKFTVLTATTGGCTFTNAAGATEAGSGSKGWAVDGQCAGITDLVSGATLTQAGAITTRMAVCTSDNAAGLPVIGQGGTSGTRWLALDDTSVAGKLNGAGPHSWFAYFKPLSFSGSSWSPVMYRDTAVGGGSPASFGQFHVGTLADRGRRLFLQTSGAVSSAWQVADGLTTFNAGTWYSLAAIYDGAGSTAFYVDGAHVVTIAQTPRTLVALRAIVIGMFSGTGSNPGSIGGGKIAGIGTWNADIGVTRVSELHAYYRGWQP